MRLRDRSTREAPLYIVGPPLVCAVGPSCCTSVSAVAGMKLSGWWSVAAESWRDSFGRLSAGGYFPCCVGPSARSISLKQTFNKVLCMVS